MACNGMITLGTTLETLFADVRHVVVDEHRLYSPGNARLSFAQHLIAGRISRLPTSTLDELPIPIPSRFAVSIESSSDFP